MHRTLACAPAKRRSGRSDAWQGSCGRAATHRSCWTASTAPSTHSCGGRSLRLPSPNTMAEPGSRGPRRGAEQQVLSYRPGRWRLGKHGGGEGRCLRARRGRRGLQFLRPCSNLARAAARRPGRGPSWRKGQRCGVRLCGAPPAGTEARGGVEARRRWAVGLAATIGPAGAKRGHEKPAENAQTLYRWNRRTRGGGSPPHAQRGSVTSLACASGLPDSAARSPTPARAPPRTRDRTSATENGNGATGGPSQSLNAQQPCHAEYRHSGSDTARVQLPGSAKDEPT